MRRLVLASTLVVVLTGCSSQPSVPVETPLGSGAPSAISTSPSASAEPSASIAAAVPTSTAPGPTNGPDVTYPPELSYADQFAMRVLVSGLNVRAKPSTGGAQLGTALKGSVFLVSDDRIQANGYTWYYGAVASVGAGKPLPALPNAILLAVNGQAGWLAAGTEATPYLEPLAPRCPTTVNLTNVQWMLSSERVSCFGSTQITLSGVYGCGGCGGANAGTFSPDWLADPLKANFLSVKPANGIGPFGIRFPAGGPAAPKEGSIIKVTGHFEDARSSTCKIAVPASDGSATMVQIASEVALAYCQAQFVVDAVVVTGTDTGFPAS